ncbi:hypothetical protein [Pedobacter foliorum]|uniref:hypothetical protein n=1 Tax=Pedobacter foliorum TaxID=2739058 RepID=UPI001562FD6B|nr:hypothetical protein [Pedobacter foliorum]NRF37734.1 hypothetical protein [Pedobacter foliorum]
MRLLFFGFLILFTTNSFAQNNGKFVKEHQSNCKIWLDEPTPTDSLTWNGNCKNNYASGTGFLQWFQNHKLAATYKGEMKQGKFDGKGKFEIIGYASFEGTFINGALNGKGAAYFNNGGKTIGNFVNGEFLNLDDKYLPILKKQTIAIKNSMETYGNITKVDNLFYYGLVPKSPIQAVLVLFPSTGETAENVISCNKDLMQQVYDKNILAVVVSANYNNTLDTDTTAKRFFDTVFEDIVMRYKAPKDKFILGGLSLGGMNALQYTEMSRNPKHITYLKPLAVIGIDPPVDLIDLYNGAKTAIVKYEKEGNKLSESKKMALQEDHFLVNEFEKQYGGSPDKFPEKYVEGSMFTRSRDDGGNAKYLINVPTRLYCDPDIVWQLKNKSRDYYDLNAANLSAMTNFLMQSGNTKAEFIPAIGKGFRVDGTRHPHSWSIVEPTDCLKWLLKLIK